MHFFLIGLAVWIAPAVLLGLYLLVAVFADSRSIQQASLQQPGHQNDNHAPEDAANRNERKVALPLVVMEANGGSEFHLRPVA